MGTWELIQVTTMSVRWTNRQRSPLTPSIQDGGIGAVFSRANLRWR